jgi:hypothetical protein
MSAKKFDVVHLAGTRLRRLHTTRIFWSASPAVNNHRCAERGEGVRIDYPRSDAADALTVGEAIKAFRDKHKDIVVKPLYGNGGAAMFRIPTTPTSTR